MHLLTNLTTMKSISVKIVIGILKLFIYFYTVLTLPIYVLLQFQCLVKKREKRTFARLEDSSDPYSAWVTSSDYPSRDEKFNEIAKATTLNEIFDIASKYGGENNECLGYRKILQTNRTEKSTKFILSDYNWLTYSQVDEKIRNIGRGFLLFAESQDDPVVILAATSIEWFLTSQALIKNGFTLATLYATLGEESICHALNETEAQVLVTTTDMFPVIKKREDSLPFLKLIVYLDENESKPKVTFERLKTVSLLVLEETGKATPCALNTNQNACGDDRALIMYTSGSTSSPKGVVLSHFNIVSAIISTMPMFESYFGKNERYLAYLPQAHMLEFALSRALYLIGIKLGFGTAQTLTDTSPNITLGQKGDASLLKPTVICTVPLVLERLRKGLEDKLNEGGPIGKELFYFAMDYKHFWSQYNFNSPIIENLFCRKIRAILGGDVKMIWCGGASLSLGTHKLIQEAFNCFVRNGYGSTESCASTTVSQADDTTYGSVGSPLYGVKIKLVDWKEGGYLVKGTPSRGEIVVGSATVAKHGYYKLPQETEEVLKEDGDIKWFYTGDIGEFSADGNLKIIDRKKDFVKLSHGEYVSLSQACTQR